VNFAFTEFSEVRMLVIPVQAMESVRKVVRAKAYFLTPEEGGRDHNIYFDVDISDPRYPKYEVLADFGFGYTKEGYKIHCAASVGLEDGPGSIELGVEQTVLVGLFCPAEVVKVGASFDLSEGPKIVAKCTVLSVIE
jgi:hypothetical protein